MRTQERVNPQPEVIAYPNKGTQRNRERSLEGDKSLWVPKHKIRVVVQKTEPTRPKGITPIPSRGLGTYKEEIKHSYRKKGGAIRDNPKTVKKTKRRRKQKTI